MTISTFLDRMRQQKLQEIEKRQRVHPLAALRERQAAQRERQNRAAVQAELGIRRREGRRQGERTREGGKRNKMRWK